MFENRPAHRIASQMNNLQARRFGRERAALKGDALSCAWRFAWRPCFRTCAMLCANCASRRGSPSLRSLRWLWALAPTRPSSRWCRAFCLRTLPVADPAQIYRIGDTDDCCVDGGFQNDNGDFDIFSYDLYQHLKNSAPEFEQLAAVQAGGTALQRAPRKCLAPNRCSGEFVSGNYFSTLGLGAYAGRAFGDSDDTPIACTRNSAQLPGMADRVCRRSFDRRIHDFHSGATLHCHRHCAARLLWGSRL